MQTRFDVDFGEYYVVFGICIWQGVIHYLLVNRKTERPDWFPAALFEVVDHRLVPGWSFAYWGKESMVGVEAILSYEELVTQNGAHYADLIERDAAALELFELRRREIEKIS